MRAHRALPYPLLLVALTAGCLADDPVAPEARGEADPPEVGAAGHATRAAVLLQDPLVVQLMRDLDGDRAAMLAPVFDGLDGMTDAELRAALVEARAVLASGREDTAVAAAAIDYVLLRAQEATGFADAR